jgi:RimJ/RimL family protein N-acetyltransferase
LGLERIVGKAMKENYASIRVLEKCGFRFLREIDFDGKTGVLYEVTRIEFTSGNHS